MARRRVYKACDWCRLKKSKQQAWLVNGLQQLYRRSVDGEGWPDDRLEVGTNGQPLIHDLLARLGVLDHTKNERFIENTNAIKQELWRTASVSRSDFSNTLLSPQKFCTPPLADCTPPDPVKSSVTQSLEYGPLADESQQWSNLNNDLCSVDQIDLMGAINYTDQTLENAISSPSIPDQLSFSCVTNNFVDFDQYLDLYPMGVSWN
ncbi:hypothetical protein E8E15_001904 [Penicillium rubens]|nr:hypothetical protein E8E15_001904 [Penicillium rubens]KAJ5033115.1 Fluconazole resistance protein 1 [Penicillium rubens]KAJ5051190.1 Fluconazole resistance protein 1 [Penicillium rubens]